MSFAYGSHHTPWKSKGQKKALRNRLLPTLTYISKKDRVEITSYTNWYKEDDIFDSEKVLIHYLAEKVNQALLSKT